MSLPSSQQNLVIPAAISTQISSGNLLRINIRLQNKSGGSVYLSFGTAVSVNNDGSYNGIEIRPFSEFIMDENCTTDTVNVMGDNVLTGNLINYTEVSS